MGQHNCYHAHQRRDVRSTSHCLRFLADTACASPLASSMFAPAVPQVMSDLGSANKELASMVVSIYVIGYALGPLVVAPLSEMYGRLVVYHVSNGLFLVFNIGCALSTNVGMLIAFRFLAGCVGVTPIVLGGASIADVMPPDSRGAATSVWASGSLVGPVCLLNHDKQCRWSDADLYFRSLAQSQEVT